jgi:hypothetical protein
MRVSFFDFEARRFTICKKKKFLEGIYNLVSNWVCYMIVLSTNLLAFTLHPDIIIYAAIALILLQPWHTKPLLVRV